MLFTLVNYKPNHLFLQTKKSKYSDLSNFIGTMEKSPRPPVKGCLNTLRSFALEIETLSKSGALFLLLLFINQSLSSLQKGKKEESLSFFGDLLFLLFQCARSTDRDIALHSYWRSEREKGSIDYTHAIWTKRVLKGP